VPLTGKQKRALRALGHHLTAVVQVGSSGVTKGVIKATEEALADHELIKVKLADTREVRAESLAALVAGTGAEVAQTIGRTVLLFKKKKKKSKFENLGKAPSEIAADAQPAAAGKKGAGGAKVKKAPGAKKALRNAAEAADDDAASPTDAVEWYEEEVEEVEEEPEA